MIPSAQGCFAGGERVGYDSGAHAIVAGQDAPIKIFLRREGDLAHALFARVTLSLSLKNQALRMELLPGGIRDIDYWKASYWKDFVGVTLRTYDPKTGLWRIYYG